MIPPTCTGIRVRTARDAEIIFHAVRLGILPVVVQRLGSEERMALCSGCVYVWEERSGSLSESMEQGIERFTEGRSWGPSRARDDFLFYHEKDTAPKSLMVERTRAIRLVYQEDPVGASAMRPRRRGEHMIKQTYSVYVQTAEGMKKWHLNAYWTQETLDRLLTVDDIPELRHLEVPSGIYLCARTNRMRETVARSAARSVYSEGVVLPSPTVSSTSTSTPYLSQRRPEEQRKHAPLSPPPKTGHGTIGVSLSPRLYSTGHELSLAPLELLEGCRRFRRDPTDEVILRSFNLQRI
ncbi:Gti1/Pac2 family-domain-containing protein [Multifurca ochricompacta]|uniref:Gti1/Pac2 family-domain-containing protein n=1 Tax=Multifurca ochricompacta TaxID=376703 RepID=A0AAD4QQI1_9AGAM|nr:Gti1/Pac2 family-domain-containing protein [Multifurca ochricompacta]